MKIAVLIGAVLWGGFMLGAHAGRYLNGKAAEAISGAKDIFGQPIRAATPLTDKEALAIRRTPVVAAIEKVSPAVVNINTEKIVQRSINPFGAFNDDNFDRLFDNFFNQFPTQSYKQQTLGSGVIIDPKGYILTNEHVIMRASKVMVTLPDETVAEARVIGGDPKFDLAILKIDVKKSLPAARTGDSDSLMIGETVIAIGNPYGLNHTVTTGVLSAIGRSIRTDQGKVFNDFLQTDASINPGNSGGPLVNLVGEVIGINTAIYEGANGIGFAIPINRAMRAVADLIRYGKIENVWSGLRAQELTQQIARKLGADGGGVLISDVFRDSPASRAGLKTGDVVVSIDSAKITNLEEFLNKSSGYLVGDTAEIEYIREGDHKKARLKMVALPVDRADELAKDLLGLTVSGIDRTQQARYNLYSTDGVVVTKVEKASPAAKIGVEPGDIIRQLGGREIKQMSDFRETMLMISAQESAFVVVQRGANLYYVRM
ncbi:MAG TPA: trypsin-like peptidase domain-containing protein [bacterium]|nr:trypsin-like peptidase domain-containing protein [bacterium]